MADEIVLKKRPWEVYEKSPADVRPEDVPPAEGFVDFFTGRKRGAGNLPEFRSRELPLQQGAAGTENMNAVLSRFAITPDEEDRAQFIQQQFPGTTFEPDEYGNTVVVMSDGTKAFLNDPGFSGQDAADLAFGAIKFIPAGRFAARGANVFTRVLRGATGGGATSIGEDVAAAGAGADFGVKGAKLAASALGGAGAEVLNPALTAVISKLRGSAGMIRDGILTAAGRRRVQAFGLDPDDISEQLARRAVSAETRGGAEAGAYDFPLTKGQRLGDEGQLALEAELRRRPDQAGEIMRKLELRQARAGERFVQDQSERLAEGSGREPLLSAAEGGAIIKARVIENAEELEQGIRQAYEAASELGDASITRGGLDAIGSIPAYLRSHGFEFDPQNYPATAKSLARIRRLVTDTPDAPATPIAQALEKQPVSGEATVARRTIAEVEEARKNLSANIDIARTPGDRKAAILVKKRFDNWLDEVFDNALFRGDERALQMLKSARSLRAVFGKRFQENTQRTRSGKVIADYGGKTVESILERGPTDEHVVNMIFGRSKLFNDQNAVEAVRSIRAASGDSPAIDSVLKQLTWRRMFEPALRRGEFNNKIFVETVDDALQQSPTLMKELFSLEELRAIREFRNTVARATQPAHGPAPVPHRIGKQEMAKAFSTTTGILGFIKGGIRGGSAGKFAGSSSVRLFQSHKAKQQALEATMQEAFEIMAKPHSRLVAGMMAAERDLILANLQDEGE